MTPRPKLEPRYSIRSPFSAPPTPVVEHFAVADRVTHDKYGLGQVVAEEATAVVVDFGSEHVRISSPYRSLTKL